MRRAQTLTGSALKKLAFFSIGFILAMPTLAFAARSFGSPDPKAPNVAQGSYVLSNAKRHRNLQTTGLATCVAVTLYDPTTKTGIMSHFSASNNAKSELKFLIQAMKDRGIPVSRLQAKMVGGWAGWSESERTSRDLKSALKESGVRLRYDDTNSKKAPPTVKAIMAGANYTPPDDPTEVLKNIQLNLQTGELHYFREKNDGIGTALGASGFSSTSTTTPTSQRGSRDEGALVPGTESLEIYGSSSRSVAHAKSGQAQR